MAELQKCPFCGGEAEVDWYEDSGNETHWFICCSDCSCKLSFGAKTSKEQAIEAWNSRVFEAEIRARAIDEVFEFLKSKRCKRYMNVNLDDLEIRKYKEQLKEE